MKNRTFPFLKFAVLLVLVVSLHARTIAQITLYNRTPLTGQTYTPISGGTVISTNAGLTVGTQDDGSVLVSLPFTFTYDGVGYNQVTFCTNGWIAMGNLTSTSTAAAGRAPANLFTATLPNTTIAAYFGDGGANFPTGNGAMVHGLAGTGVYAFEWRNACAAGFTQSTVNTINYMIKIYGAASSAPGRIEILYGAYSGTGLSTGRSLGIEDATGGANHFINALNGSFTATTTNTAWPGNGNGYRFDPAPPCTGKPNSGSIVAPSAVCPGNFTISLNGNTFGPGITYQWQSKPTSGGAFANIGTNSSTLTTAITVPTDFQCIVTCTNSGLSSTTTAVSIGINSFYACYCKGSLGGAATGPSIDSVSILQTTLNNGSRGVAPSFYTQYPASGNTTANLQAGGVYYLFVKYGSGAKGSAWLDANRNGTFENSEWVQINASGTSGLLLVQIPPTAATGLTGLRIRSTDPTATNGAGNMCTSFTSGETEDYIVNITPAPANDLKVVTLLSPPAGNPGICPFTDMDVRAVIYNNGTNAQNGFSITAVRTGPVPALNPVPYTKVLQPFKLDTVTLATYNFIVTGSFNTKAFISGAVDLDQSNDTSANFPFHVLFSANLPLPNSDSVCYGETALLTVHPDTVKHNWYHVPTGGSPFYTGDTITIPNLQHDSVLYVRSAGRKSTGSLTTLNATNNNCTAGTMFDVVPNINLSLDSIAALFTTTGSQSITVYYKVGSYVGSETNPSAWTSLGTYTVNPVSTANFTMVNLSSSLQMLAGTTYGMYLNYNSAYTNGSAPYSNADMTINTGKSFCTAFTSPISDRMFNGTLYYSKGSDLCESPSQVITAFAGPIPAANLGPDLTVCENQEIILDAGFAGGGYIWNTGEVNQTIKVKNGPGTYWVLVDKYCTSSDTIDIFQNPLPHVSGISYQKAGNTYSFTAANATDVKSFIWNFGDGTTETGSLTPTHVYADEKEYKVTLMLYNDCGGDTTDLVIPVGIRTYNINGAALQIYPNPATNALTVDIQGLNKPAELMIINSVGKVVYKMSDVVNGKTDINLDGLSSANYILRVSDGENALTKPFVISR